jgi:UDP-N-acetylglucosamine:LPS N-acetylglucosamine transferase
VVTDLADVHRTWNAPGVRIFYTATEHAYRSLRRAGVAATRILVTGLPPRRPFWSAAERMSHAACDPLRVLLMNGGRPGPALQRTLHTLLGAGLSLEISVACGEERDQTPGLPYATGACMVRVLPPWAVAQQMVRADLLVSKAGSVTIAEALAVGCPLVLHRAVPGQESSNPQLVESAGVGWYAPSPGRLVAAVRLLSRVPDARAAMALRAAQLGRPQAALDVAKHLCTAMGFASTTHHPRAS